MRAAPLLFAALVVAGCQAYDTGLLGIPGQVATPATCGDGKVTENELCDSAIADGDEGACPDECKQASACELSALTGKGCMRECVTIPITIARDNDGCCPPGEDPTSDSDCAKCGDGMVTGDETCDPISSCPSREDCKTDNPCLTVEYHGDSESCQVSCTLTPTSVCRDRDKCCPEGCNSDSDDDCSAACGDGVVDPEEGETCEPESAEAPCPRNCDDGLACTRDIQIGRRELCNVSCVHVAITQPIDGDGCCLPDLTRSSDSDCAAVCGNGTLEGDEQCDGDASCGENCRPLAVERPACADPSNPECEDGAACDDDCVEAEQPDRCAGLPTRDACDRCMCERCSAATADCYSSPQSRRNVACGALADCSRRSGCSGDACYCGDSPFCANPNGSCVSQVQVAAQSIDPQEIDARGDDPRFAIQPARIYGDCRRSECAAVCGR